MPTRILQCRIYAVTYAIIAAFHSLNRFTRAYSSFGSILIEHSANVTAVFRVRGLYPVISSSFEKCVN